MSFKGFHITHTRPDSPSSVGVTHVTCQKCGRDTIRETRYMKEVCEKITCPKCGNTATRSDIKRRDENDC